MSIPVARAQFDQGIGRAVQHWLDCWPAQVNDPADRAHLAGHALAALRWSVATGQALEPAVDLALAIQSYVMYQGQWSEWEALLHRLLEQASCVSQERLFALRHLLGMLYMRQHRLAESLALSGENYRWALAMSDRRRQAEAAISLAEVYLNAQDFEQALAHAEEATALAVAHAMSWQQADGLIDAARALIGLGELAEAERRLRQADALATKTGYPVYQAKAQLFLGQLLGRTGRWQEALQHLETARRLVISYGDEVGRATVQISLGRTLAEMGRLDEAIHLLEDAVIVHRRHGNHPAEGVALERLREVMARRDVDRGESPH